MRAMSPPTTDVPYGQLEASEAKAKAEAEVQPGHVMSPPRRPCRRWAVPPLVREAVAEFWGTFILMVFGLGSVAQFVLSEGQTGTSDQIRWSWGFGVTFGVYTAGGISGGHLNPAVTLALCLARKCSWRKLPLYWLGQYAGAFISSLVVYIVYYDGIHSFKGGNLTMETAGIFSTYPQEYLSLWNGLADQIFGTAVLLFLITALTDQDNMGPSKGYLPLAIGLVVTTIGMTFGLNCGYAINPARDLSPRLFTLVAGWGRQVFSHNNYQWFWVPVIGPHIGAILGVSFYSLFIQMRSPFYDLCPSNDVRRLQNSDSIASTDVQSHAIIALDQNEPLTSSGHSHSSPKTTTTTTTATTATTAITNQTTTDP